MLSLSPTTTWDLLNSQCGFQSGDFFEYRFLRFAKQVQNIWGVRPTVIVVLLLEEAQAFPLFLFI